MPHRIIIPDRYERLTLDDCMHECGVRYFLPDGALSRPKRRTLAVRAAAPRSGAPHAVAKSGGFDYHKTRDWFPRCSATVV